MGLAPGRGRGLCPSQPPYSAGLTLGLVSRPPAAEIRSSYPELERWAAP